MAAIERTSSTISFAPGSHRRSYPNLQHLSLAPLTPKYPISPSDYDAYVDPETSRLHTSSSFNQISGRQSSSSFLLTPTHQTHIKSEYRKSKSSANMQYLGGSYEIEAGAEELSNNMLRPPGSGGRKLTTEHSIDANPMGSTWLLQTGINLTEGSRESKGQSWLSKRASSTSLHSPTLEDYSRSHETHQPRCDYEPRIHSRRSSASRGRRRSRRDLVMTPTIVNDPSQPTDVSQRMTPKPERSSVASPPVDDSSIEPDWVDASTQAEIAAALELQLATELDDGELYSNDGDGYESAEIAAKAALEEEQAVKQAVRFHGFRIGTWVDNVIDVFLRLDDADEEEVQAESDKIKDDNEVDLATKQIKQSEGLREIRKGDRSDDGLADDIEPAPQNPGSVWEDIAWFARLVLGSAKT